MALIVQKFGGTSVGTVERIQHVARWALDSQAKGDDIVLVVSAMSGETNRLVELANKINPIPFSREYDLLIASGEQVAVGLVALAINTEAEKRGLIPRGASRARGLLGHQIGILTDTVYSKARIQSIDTGLILAEVTQKIIPVIAGFQGVDTAGNITTLGRGGSDTSAVAIAAALKGQVRYIQIGRSRNFARFSNTTPIEVVDGDAAPELVGLPYLATTFRRGGFCKTMYTPSTLRVVVGRDWNAR